MSDNVTVLTDPIMLDKTGLAIAAILADLNGQRAQGRVVSLDDTELLVNNVVDAQGAPKYVDDVTQYADYHITETGWYVFARIRNKYGMPVTGSTHVIGADGYIATIGAEYIDVAVRFGVAGESRLVTIDWGEYTDKFIFRATDLALRNLDYRSTYVEYDIGEYVTWSYALTTDETFVRYRQYFTLEDGEYKHADVIYGDPVPADTYYVHTLAHVEGMPRNITFMSAEIIDCPVEIVLPEIPEDGYGAWFEFRLRYDRQCSCTLIPPSDDVHITTDNLANHTAGINIIDLHYSFTGGNKSWSLISTHRSLNEYRHLVSLEFVEPPTKSAYVAGETLDLTGAKVVATFSDGSKHNVTTNETGNAATTRVTSYSPANGAALTTANDKVTCTFKYMEGHTVLQKTLTCTTPLTVTEG